jgi:hypothetical protein
MSSMRLLMENWRQFESAETMLQERSIMKEKYPFKAVYVVGPAGAGKSYLGGKVGIPSDFITSNTDARIENVFAAYNIPLTFADDEASDMAKLQQNVRTILQNADHGHATNLVLKGAPLLFDTTGEGIEKISGRIQRLVDMGYDVAVLQINVPPSVSVSRDKQRGEGGGRSVGAERVDKINRAYQEKVVKGQGYAKAAGAINKTAGGGYVTILGGAVIPNIYALDSFGKFKEGDLTVSEEEAAAVGNPSFEQVKKMVDQAVQDMAGFLGTLKNPKGNAIVAGMKALISGLGSDASAKDAGMPKGFSRGQSVRDLWAVRGTAWAQIPAVSSALQAMGGDPGIAVSGAVRGKKGARFPGEPGTVRGASRKHGTLKPSDPNPKMTYRQAKGEQEYDPKEDPTKTQKRKL